MSESANGTGAAPAPSPGPQPSGADIKPAAVAPLGQSPRLREGISLEEAVKRVGESRRGGERPPRRAAPAAGEAAATPQLAAGPHNNGAAAGNGHAAPAEAPADPIDGLINAYRQRNAPPGAPNGADPAPGANGAPPPPNGQAPGAPAELSGPVRLTIDGREVDFTPQQLTAAVRQANDYTNKTKQLAEVHRQVAERAAAIERMLPVLMPEIERQIAALDAQLGRQPDWKRLAATDPAEYQRQDAAWKEAAAERQRLDSLMAVQQQETEQARQKRLTDGHAQLTQALPGWDDAATRGKLQSEMIRWGRTQGFPDNELNSIYEPRHVIALFKAMAFDRMMHGVRSDAPMVPNVQRGRAPPQAGSPQASDAERRFADAPTQRNAVKLLAARRGGR